MSPLTLTRLVNFGFGVTMGGLAAESPWVPWVGCVITGVALAVYHASKRWAQ